MLQTEQAQLAQLIVHQVGNISREEDLLLSGKEIFLDEQLTQLLLGYFLNPFKKQETYYQFDATHAENPVFSLCSEVFAAPETLVDSSQKLAQHLFEASTHPQIKSGEFYVAYFTDLVVEDELVEAIGLFKSENKDTYLKVYPHKSAPSISAEQGINIHRLDKGCIVFNTEKEHGYKLSVVDLTNKQSEAQYWKDTFLKAAPRQDDFYQTHQYMKMYHEFTNEVFKEQPERPKAQKAEMLNKSVAFFAENEQFDERQFVEEVIGEPEIIDAFKTYKQQHLPETAHAPEPEFAISKKAVDSARKKFKSVLKLDKNFHVYVHGSPEMLERGFDEERNLSFYKLFFDQEQ